MDAHEIAELKDSILKSLSNRTKIHISVTEIFNVFKPENMSLKVFNGYVDDMFQDKVINRTPISGGRVLISITDKGEKFLFEGGYIALIKKELQKEAEEQEFNKLIKENILTKRQPLVTDTPSVVKAPRRFKWWEIGLMMIRCKRKHYYHTPFHIP